MSKAVAAGAVRLADPGAITLDEDVNARLRSWRVPVAAGATSPITQRQLLSHLAGLSLGGYPAMRRARACRRCCSA
jgi:CubicO group peptidase (beta-lactamase class C family)